MAAWEARQAERRRQLAEETPPLRREEGKTAAYFAAGSLDDDDDNEEEEEEDESSRSGGSSSGDAGNATRAEGAAAVEGIYLPRCLCVLSKYPFVDTTRAWLMQLYRLSLSPTPGTYLHAPFSPVPSHAPPPTKPPTRPSVPLERYISNFLLEVPAPVPGRMGVQLHMLDQSLDYPCPLPHEPLAWSGVPFEPVLEMAAPEALLGAFGCVLLEQQLLLHSSSLSLLTATVRCKLHRPPRFSFLPRCPHQPTHPLIHSLTHRPSSSSPASTP